MSSLDPLQRSHQLDPLLGMFHDRPSNLQDCRQVSPPPVSGQALPGIKDPTRPRSPLRPPESSTNPTSDPPDWKQLLSNSLDTRERTSLIAAIFSSPDEVKIIRHLCRGEAQALVDAIHEELDDLDHTLRMRCLHFLYKICGSQSILPRSLVIPVSYDRTQDPLCRGGFADVWKGRSQGQDVAVKVLRTYQNTSSETRKRFCKEVVMWNTLHHPNVLPLLGVMMTDNHFAMVSEWMANGNITEFVEAHPDADRLELLRDVGRGLEYLHGQELIHGDLKGANILIDYDNHARIADFGLLTVIPNHTNIISTISHSSGGTTRWTSPELLDPGQFGLEDARPTKESDCYALGMVVYEVLSGQVPFAQCVNTVVILKVMGGERPGRPQGAQGAWFTDDLWEILELCWKPQPGDRPGLGNILRCLKGVARPSRRTPTPLVNGIVEESASEPLDLTATNPAGLISVLNGDQPPALPQDIPRGAKHQRRGGGVREENQQQMLLVTPPHQLPTSTLLRRIAHWDGSSQEISQVLTATFEAEDYLDCIKGLEGQGIDTQSYIDSLDQIIDVLPLDPGLRKRCIWTLKKACILHQLLPASCVFRSGLGEPDTKASAHGRFSDVWKLTDGKGHVFAVKSLRVCQSISELYKRLYAEVILGRHLKHPNILSIEGVASQLFKFSVVSRWMTNGNMLQYITDYPAADHLELLIGVTRGLDYLHDNDIVHKNLRATNVLIDEMGSPRLHICNVRGEMSRYWAPEHHSYKPDAEREKMTTNSDVYSLSMVIVGLVTRNVPFPEFTDANVMILVLKGGRPPKPHRFEVPGLTSEVWKIAEMCWHEEPRKRPEVRTILHYLEDLANPENARVKRNLQSRGLSFRKMLPFAGRK